MIMSMTRPQKGVTIIEVLVALAIISLVFVIFAKVFQQFSGRESLKQSANLLVADINDVLSDVKDGVYYDQAGVECDYDPATGFKYEAVSGARAGQNNRCLFLGKAVLLGTDPAKVGNGEDAAVDYYVYTLVGNAADRNRNKNRISFTDFKVDVFKDPGGTFDATEKQHVSSRGAIAETYIWPAADSNGVVDKTNEVIYIDGFAIVYADFGVVPGDAAGSVTGAARNLRVLPLYPCSQQGTTDDQGYKKDGDRSRPTQALFESRTRENRGSDCSSDAKNYYHYAHTFDSSSHAGDIAGGEIVVCLEGPAGKAYVSVGSRTGVITAEAELDSQRADDKCG